MTSKTIITLTLVLTAFNGYAQYDIVIVGGNPGGIRCAIAAANKPVNAKNIKLWEHLSGTKIAPAANKTNR